MREQVLTYFEKIAKSSARFTIYRCNHCKKLEPVHAPKTKADCGSKGYWDSLTTTTCLSCGRYNFVFIWPNGRTISRKFPPAGLREENEHRQVATTFEIISKLVLK